MERKGNNRITTPYLNKYEICRLVGTRALCVALNSPCMEKVSSEQNADALAISFAELKSKKLPLKIRRHLPDGTYEDWGIEELKF